MEKGKELRSVSCCLSRRMRKAHLARQCLQVEKWPPHCSIKFQYAACASGCDTYMYPPWKQNSASERG